MALSSINVSLVEQVQFLILYILLSYLPALQFEQAYAARRLGNWELPKWQTKDPPRPRQRKGSTKIIANERGHLLDTTKKYKHLLDRKYWVKLMFIVFNILD